MNYNLSEQEMDVVGNAVLNSVYSLRNVVMAVHALAGQLTEAQYIGITSSTIDTAYQLAKLFIIEPNEEAEKIKLLDDFSDFMYGITDKSTLDKLITDSISRYLSKEV